MGAEHVSYSAVLTLREAGVRTIAMVTDLARTQTVPAFGLATRWGLRVPVLTNTTVVALLGHDRLSAVRLRAADGSERELAVDTVVFTGDWIPDHELARLAGLGLDPGTRGPLVDGSGRTSADGVFAVGNLVHPVETADVAATRATGVAASALSWLRRLDAEPAFATSVPVGVDAPLTWVSPNLVRAGDASAATLVRTGAFVEHPRLRVVQGDRTLATYRLRRMVPNRSHHVGADWRSRVDPAGGPVRISLV